jgi:outer membrane protein
VKRFAHILALALGVLSFSVMSAEGVKVAFVNAGKVFEQSPQYAEAKKRLETEFARRNDELVSKNETLEKLQNKLERDTAVMSASEINKLEKDILSRKRRLKNAQAEFREDLNLRQNEEFNKLRRQVREVVREVGKDEKIDLVVSEGVVYFSKRIDISDLVLIRLKELDKQRAVQ